MTQEEKTQLEKELTQKFGSKVTISIGKSDKDYSKEPFFVEKLAKAKEILSKAKFTEGFFDKKQPTPAVGM